MPTHCGVVDERSRWGAMQKAPVSVLVVDDHPALRAGLEQLLDQEPGYQLLGAVSSEAELAIALHRHRPDVVVMDYALTRGDGLSACFRLKQRPHAPGVVLYSAYVDDVFAVPATLAQADAIVSKNDPVEVLLAAIDAAATAESQVPPPDPELIEAASARLDADDLPIVGMLFARVQAADIASTLGVEPRDVRSRALRIIGQMQAHDRRQGHAAV
jgi:DNA-binding NarL/FixJ family response regulator